MAVAKRRDDSAEAFPFANTTMSAVNDIHITNEMKVTEVLEEHKNFVPLV